MRWIVAVFAAIIGFVGTYFGVANVSCIWIWPESNLCGLIAVPSAFVVAAFVFFFVVIKWK